MSPALWELLIVTALSAFAMWRYVRDQKAQTKK